MAARAVFYARSAMIVIAALAPRHTFVAVDAVAARAVAMALAAHHRFALFTGPTLIVPDGVPAVGAFNAVPVRE